MPNNEIKTHKSETVEETSFAQCKDCGMPYGGTDWVDVILTDAQWITIFPEKYGLLCANCIVKRAAKLGAITIKANIEF